MGSHLGRYFPANFLLAAPLVVLYQIVQNLVDGKGNCSQKRKSRSAFECAI